MGSLSPFSRNHNIKEGISQEAYALGERVLEAARKNLQLRYSLLKFYYRHFIIRKGTGVIYRPIFLDFPTDDLAYNDETVETQFIIGKELMVAPILNGGANRRSVYFPAESNWYNFYSGERYSGSNVTEITNSITDYVPIFLLEGAGVAIQDVTNVLKTKQLDNSFIIKAALKLNKELSTNSKSVYQA